MSVSHSRLDEIELALQSWRDSGYRNELFTPELISRMGQRLADEAAEARATIVRLKEEEKASE